jgi:FixJ family two-component response regulator
MRLSAVDFLIKPFGLESLLPLVERSLARAAAA